MSLTSEEYKNLSKGEFTRAAEKYETNHAGVYELCKKDYPDILKEIETEDFETLLDAGCGPAPMIELLTKKYPNKHYTGIDLTEKMIELARNKNLPNTEFVVGDCENLPFTNNSFDVIICSMSAHHYPEIQKFYDSTYRCLKTNGRLILRDMTSGNGFMRFFVSHIEMPLAHVVGKGDVCMLKREDVDVGLKKAGFKVLKNEQRKGFRLHVVAKKEK